MRFPTSQAGGRAPVLVRAQNRMLSGLSNARDGLVGKMSLAVWYYINEDKSNTPDMVNWIYAAAKANIAKRTGKKVDALACGLSQIYRKNAGAAHRSGKQDSIGLTSILEFMQKKANEGDKKYQGYLNDLNEWYDEILKG